MVFRRYGLVLLVMLAVMPVAGAKSAAAEPCLVKNAPAVTVKVETADIAYDFSKTARELTAMKADTVSPYPPGSDSVSGGLRQMQPVISTLLSWNLTEWPKQKTGCLTYKTVDVTIVMDPKIYVAREFNKDACRNAILQHERKHVTVDRVVMNKYAGSIGRVIQAAVNRVGAMGPFALDRKEEMQNISASHIENAIKEQISLMNEEMRRQQQKIDSLEEYKYVSSFCNDIKFPR